MYPDPSSKGSINLRLSQDQPSALDLVVTDLSGREISRRVSGTTVETSLSIAQPGMYLVAVLKDGQQIAVKKAVIQ
ncbi:MAG: T9SS type A sorting domain-containing protein [Bacteroidia bacterium]